MKFLKTYIVLFQINLVVKRPSDEKILHESFNIDAYFHNEILFYTKYGENYKYCPSLVYAFEEPPHNSIIVMSNISQEGYFLSTENMSTKYILAAVRELARFHATGYVFKENNPIQFFEIVKNIHDYRTKSPRKLFNTVNYPVPRVLRYLQKEKFDQDFCNKLDKFLSDSRSNILLGMTKPTEPLATLCHGDFTRNNIFFKESDGEMKVQLIDFAMITYCSPSLDLSLFLFFSGSGEHRNKKFPELFSIYCNTLLQSLKEAGLLNLERFSRKLLLEDYKLHALYGYSLVSTFLPIKMGCFVNFLEEFMCKEINQIREIYDYIGGDELTKVLVDMILDLKETGCLDHIVNV